MAEPFTYNGIIYEPLPNGKVRVVGYAQPGIQTKPADPRLPYQIQQDQGQAAAAQYAAPKAQADATIAQANAANAGVVANAEAAKAQADADKARFELEKLKTEQAKVDPKSGAYRALQDQIDRVTFLYKNNIQGGAPNFINNYIPDTFQNQVGAFDAASQGLTNPFMAAFRIQGQGSQSDTGLRQFLAANTPAQGDNDAVIEEKLRNIQTRLNAEVPPGGQTDKTQPPIDSGQPAQNQVVASTGTRDEVDPILKGIGQRVSKMASAGASEATINEFLRKNGVDPANTNIPSVIQWRDSPGGKAWMRANPGKAIPLGAQFYTKQVPLTPGQKIGNAAAQSAPGAYLMNAAQGLTGNRLDELASALGGNGEAVNTGLQLSRANSPASSFVGDLSGQAMAQYLMGRIPGLGALPGSSAGRMAEDALYGAYAGGGEDGNYLGGAAANVVGGKLTRGAARVGKTALTGLNGSSLRYLDNADIPLTIGQLGRGSGGPLGDSIGGLEDRAAGLPGFDAIINSARRRGEEGLNRAAFREMGGSGATGSAGISEGRNMVKGAYSFLDPLNLPVDAQFAGRNAAVKANLPSNFGSGVSDRLADIDGSVIAGNLSGRDWQSAVRGVRGDRSSIAGQPFAGKATDALNEVEDNLMGLAQRQGPPGTTDSLSAANKLNSQFQTLVSALDNGPTQRRGELFSASRLDDASRAGARNYGGRVSSMEGNRPFYKLSQAAMEVMPNQVPDSGTAGRALMYAPLYGLGGASLGAGSGAIIGNDDRLGGAASGAQYGSGAALPLLLAAGLYSKTGQKAIQKAILAERPAILRKAGDALNADNFISKGLRKALSKRAAGMFGSAVARDAFLYPELQAQ